MQSDLAAGAGSGASPTPSFRGRRGISVLLLLTLLLSGCYTSRPIATPVPVPGTRITAGLTQGGAAEVAALIGPHARSVEGVVVGVVGEREWQLSMIRVEQTDGQGVFWNREVVTLPASAFHDVRERQLDRRRSVILAGGIVGAALLLGQLFGAIGGSGEDGSVPPPPPPAQ